MVGTNKIVHPDRLAVTDEEGLRHRARNLQRAVRRCKNRQKRQLIEIEFCYLVREIEIRELRRKAHEDWFSKQAFCRSNPEEVK